MLLASCGGGSNRERPRQQHPTLSAARFRVSGTGLMLSNGRESLAVTGNGTFRFPTAVPSGTGYNVSNTTQPSSPTQTCAIANASGTVARSNVTNVPTISCQTNTYIVGGTVSGLNGSGLQVVTSDGVSTAVTGNGALTLSNRIPSGSTFAVSIRTQPSSPSQVCTINNATGTVTNNDINVLSIACVTNTYLMGGTLSGVLGTGLTIVSGNGQTLLLDRPGHFSFPSAISSGASYAVRVTAAPQQPAQLCEVTNASGTIADADVTDIVIQCIAPRPPPPLRVCDEPTCGGAPPVVVKICADANPSCTPTRSTARCCTTRCLDIEWCEPQANLPAGYTGLGVSGNYELSYHMLRVFGSPYVEIWVGC